MGLLYSLPLNLERGEKQGASSSYVEGLDAHAIGTASND